MDFQFFIASDTSKDRLNFAVWHGGKAVLERQSPNTVAGVRRFIRELRRLDGFSMGCALFCAEHTGIYNFHLLKALQQAGASVSLVGGAEVKLSLGLQRGKDDVVDARRIAEYAARFTDRLALWKPVRKVVERMQQLSALRDRLVKTLAQLRTPLEEGRGFMEEADWKLLEKSCRASVAALEGDIAEVDRKIQELINSDGDLKKMFAQVTSVPGVGKVTAQNIIIESNEFRDFSDPRKFACHAGVAPFGHSSGSSIRGRARVSHKANKKLKTLLHLCAMAAIRRQGEMRDYYERKVGEGKNKMSVLNAVRNKIIHRVFAVVRNDVMYQNNYQFNLCKS